MAEQSEVATAEGLRAAEERVQQREEFQQRQEARRKARAEAQRLAEEARQRAVDLLESHLTRAQRIDLTQTGWFNVKDAHGYLWRVKGAAYGVSYPNLIDGEGNGRSMVAVHSPRDPLGVHDVDLVTTLVMMFQIPDLATYISEVACSDGGYGDSPWDWASFYEQQGEPDLADGECYCRPGSRYD